MPGKDNLSFERERKKGAFVILHRNKCENGKEKELSPY